ncbi:hypothetical protein AX774_g2154 [Zancudomyces culisetae]|uniref:Uncharacterized protein n=1 Tax=Zancudomyces culisetae TaxID=1213189 RepID=A0A1R1PTT8_ZANCU|nr:hypothetical protein AX774_g2154 [Zancudomyces culisetae]|eukprot:OMH84323.1 hypothetical protein AX774_g2154 [Zancudomyces culisetae]
MLMCPQLCRPKQKRNWLATLASLQCICKTHTKLAVYIPRLPRMAVFCLECTETIQSSTHGPFHNLCASDFQNSPSDICPLPQSCLVEPFPPTTELLLFRPRHKTP